MTNRDDARTYDVRTLERNLRKGLINKKDYDKYLKGLPDAADKLTACNPEAQSRENDRPHPPAPRVVVVTPAIASADDLPDELDDELDDEDEDEDDLDEEEDEADAEGTEKK